MYPTFTAMMGSPCSPIKVLDLELSAALLAWLTILMLAVFLITESLILPLKPVIILVLIFTPTDPNYESSLGIATGYMDGIFIFSVAFGLSVG